MRGGPGTSEPDRILYSGVTLTSLLSRAYGLYADQVRGPGWLSSETYTVAANVPAGATKEQFDLMLRNLLVERFKLVLHWEKKDFTVYQLVVAKGGPKLQRAAVAPSGAEAMGAPPKPATAGRGAVDRDGCPILPPGESAAAGGIGALACHSFRKLSVPDFARTMEKLVALETGEAFGPTVLPSAYRRQDWAQRRVRFPAQIRVESEIPCGICRTGGGRPGNRRSKPLWLP